MARILPPVRWETVSSYLRRLAVPATSIDVHLVGLTNVVCQVGIAQRGRRRAHCAGRGRRRRHGGRGVARPRPGDRRAVARPPLVGPDDGWPLLVGTARLALTPAGASARLSERG
jgi:hypothetical protein